MPHYSGHYHSKAYATAHHYLLCPKQNNKYAACPLRRTNSHATAFTQHAGVAFTPHISPPQERRRNTTVSLRHKILFPLFAVLLIGFSALGVTAIHSVSNSLEENIVASVEREGRLIFRSIDGMLKNAENNLLHMREEAIVGQFAKNPQAYRQNMEMALQKFSVRLDLFHAVGFVSANGYLLASSAVPNAQGTLFLGHQSHYVAAMAGNIGISGMFKSSTANKDGQFPAIIVVAVPVYVEGQIVGALFASLDMTRFEKDFMETNGNTNNDLHTLLLNDAFVPVLHPDQQRRFVAQGDDITAIRAAHDNTVFRFANNGTPTWGLRMTHPSGKWYLAFIGPTQEVLAPVVTLRRALLAAFATITAVVLLLTYRLVGGLLLRVTRVMYFAQHVAQGHLVEHIPETSNDELGQLAASVETMVHSLGEMVEKAEASNKSKSRFLARMSHEIRTPMNAIMGMAHLCQQTQLTPQQQGYVQKIYAACKNLLAVVNDILDFSSIEAGKLSIEQTPFCLGTLLVSLQDLMDITAQEKKLFFSIQRNPDVPEAFTGGQTRLLQVLVNLCGNALKFTQQGGVTLHVAVQSQNETHCVLLFTVRDTGIGIAKTDSADIFLPFEQAEGSATRTFEGTGLGLAISKRIVELMGGAIGMHSEVGVGSEFFFTVPLQRQQEHAPQECLEQSLHEANKPQETDGLQSTDYLQGLHILVVEDNLINQEIITDMLESLGITVSIASDGCEGVAMAAAMPYDIILMDIAMPKMDGFQATQAIRQGDGPNSLHTPILALTAHAFAEDKEKSLVAGMNDYLTKPIDYAVLTNKLVEHAGRK